MSRKIGYIYTVGHCGVLCSSGHPRDVPGRLCYTITVDVRVRSITLNVTNAKLAARKLALKAPQPRFERGCGWMVSRHIGQADDGCGFDFLRTDFGGTTGEPAIF